MAVPKEPSDHGDRARELSSVLPESMVLFNSGSHAMNDSSLPQVPIQGVVYNIEPKLTAAEFIAVLRTSTLAERRPVDDLPRIESMLRHADLILTARCEDTLVGVARALTDFSFCTYLSDLAVSVPYQKQGIGRELLRRTHEAAGRQTKLILLAAPNAASYYPHIGLSRHDSCWIW